MGFQVATSIALLAVFGFLGAPPASAQNFDDVKIENTPLGSGLHLLTGRGGNLVLSTGADGSLLVDDQFAELTPRIRAKIAALSPAPLRFVLNTHWHGDHTGGNENLARERVVIVAHEAVRERMSVEQFMEAFGRRVPASPPAALPVVTFSSALTLHWNELAIEAQHLPAAHTDGDSLVYFRGANVLHMGDTFFNGTYPFIDLSSGGSLDGVIAAADRGLALADARTRIVPGHGPLATREDLGRYRAMLEEVRTRVATAVAAGRSTEEVVSAGLPSELDAAWGGGFMKPEVFVRIVDASLRASGPARER